MVNLPNKVKKLLETLDADTHKAHRLCGCFCSRGLRDGSLIHLSQLYQQDG